MSLVVNSYRNLLVILLFSFFECFCVWKKERSHIKVSQISVVECIYCEIGGRRKKNSPTSYEVIIIIDHRSTESSVCVSGRSLKRVSCYFVLITTEQRCHAYDLGSERSWSNILHQGGRGGGYTAKNMRMNIWWFKRTSGGAFLSQNLCINIKWQNGCGWLIIQQSIELAPSELTAYRDSLFQKYSVNEPEQLKAVVPLYP